MSRAVLDSIRRITPTAAPAADGVPRALPASLDELAHLVGLAAAERWRIRIEGRGSWCPADAPADLAIGTTALARIPAVAPADLVATAQAGVGLRSLAGALAAHGAWLALDPPGDPDRTLGSILATATAGPLRHRAGPVRDHVLGVTVVTGSGAVVRAGGSVVKNVAGYDLTKLAVGGFGAFGLIAEAHLRLRALPAARASLLARAPLGEALDAALAVTRSGAEVATLELLSPGLTGATAWTLLVRLHGTEAGVAGAADRVRGAGGPARWERVEEAAARGIEQAVARAAVDAPVTLRFGVLPDGMPDTLDLLGRALDTGRVSASAGRGGIRWSGTATADRIRALRAELAHREIPVTLERAPWPLRRAVGHFGAYREGVGALTARLRQVFDPERLLVVPLEGGDNG